MLSTKRLHTTDSWLLSTESWQATSLLKLKLRTDVKQIFMNVQNALFVKLLFLLAVQNAFLLFLISQLGQLSIFIELLSKSQRREKEAHINKNVFVFFWERIILNMQSNIKIDHGPYKNYKTHRKTLNTLPLFGSSRGLQAPFVVLSFGKEMSFATRDAEMGCTSREVRFDRFCLKLPSVFKREKQNP